MKQAHKLVLILSGQIQPLSSILGCQNTCQQNQTESTIKIRMNNETKLGWKSFLRTVIHNKTLQRNSRVYKDIVIRGKHRTGEHN